MSNSHFSGPLVQGTDKRPAGATNVFTQRVVCAAGASFAGAVRSSGGFEDILFVNGNVKQVASGTYIGSGAATAAIVNTGLTTVHHVFLMRNWQSRTAGATTRAAYSPSPALAVGTPSSFYPLVGFIAPGGAAAHTLGIGAGATFKWLAFGAA